MGARAGGDPMSAISAIKQALEDGFSRGDEASLVAFYEALLAGELLVVEGGGEAALAIAIGGALDGGGAGGDAPLLLAGSRGPEGEAEVAAFTGDEELDAWASSGGARRTLPVVELAGALLDAGVQVLALNPAGPVGRRLDVVELRQLAAGSRPRSGRASFGFDQRSGVAVAAPAVDLTPALTAALVSVCAHTSDIAAAYLVELMHPRRSAAVELTVALEVDDPTDAARREAVLELVGAVVTQVPGAALDGIGFLWLDGRLDGLVRARVAAAYRRAGPK